MEDELKDSDHLPNHSNPNPTVDIEAFLDRRARLDQYADLDLSTLGITEFPVRDIPKVSVNKTLTKEADTGSPGARNRWRSTLAHEASHVILHAALFEVPLQQTSFFDVNSESSKTPERLMRCLKRDIGFSSSGSSPREFQANRGMAALLMPKSIFIEAAETVADDLGTQVYIPAENSPLSDQLTKQLAKKFLVSRQAIVIRLKELSLLRPTGQTRLGLD